MSRKLMIQTVNELKKNKMGLIELRRLNSEVGHFYNNIILRNINSHNMRDRERRIFDSIIRLRKARANYDNCLSIIKSNFELENNSYIQQSEKSFKSFTELDKLLGVANARLDMIFNQTQELAKKRELSERTDYPSITLIENFKQTLITFMNNIIIHSLSQATKKFIEIEYTKTDKKETVILVKDSNLFFWILFTEVYNSAQIEGSLERQAGLTGKFQAIKPTDMPRTLQTIPTNVNTTDERKDEWEDFPQVEEF